MSKKPKASLRSPVLEKPIITGGDGSWSVQPPIDPHEVESALEALCEVLSVEIGDWRSLAEALAFKGGFIQLQRPIGKIPHWNEYLRVALVLSVEMWAHENQVTADATIKAKAFRDRWGEDSGQVERAATLSARYYETRRDWRERRGAAFDVLWMVETMGDALPMERRKGLIGSLLSQARIERAHERMLRDIATDLT